MRTFLTRLVLLTIAFAALSAQAQITFRSASTATVAGVAPPAFRAASSATTTSGTLTIPAPAGSMPGQDVLIASIAVTPSSATITPPGGWTLVRRLDNAGPTSNSLAVYSHFFTGVQSFAWGVSGATFAVGGIQAFTGVDTLASSPIDAESGQNTPVGTAHTAPSISATANAMLVTSHAFASARTWTPPSGMTESFDRPSGSNNATGLSIGGSRALHLAGGASGGKTATAAGNADAGNAHILALRPRRVTLVIPPPAGTVAGDVMIAAVAFNNSSASIVKTDPSWTLVRRIDNATATSNSLLIYRTTLDDFTAGSGFGLTIAGAASLVGGIQAFSGVDPANPIDAESGRTTPSGTSHDTPSIMTSTPNTMLVTAHSYASSQSWTPQAGLTESFDRASGAASATGQSITGARQAQAAAGASGTKRSTAASSADVGNTHILALRRLIPNVPPTVSLTSPTGGATFTAPANITLTATAADSDGTIQKVEFFHDGTNLITAITVPPYSFTWTGVAQGTYTLTAVATDNQNATTTSAPVNVTVDRAAALHFIHVDHLNTPRLIANQTGQTVWRWDQQEPFGVSPADENPSGLGVFKFPLRFAGQYDDPETGLFYNYFRDCYDPVLGRYCQSDPVGLDGGIDTYVYASLNPLSLIDPDGLLGRAPGTFGTGGSTYQTQGNVWGGFTPQNATCDFPMINLNPCVTNCCKAHDDCFNKYKCNWSSWFGNMFGTTFKCQGCNTEARKCIVNAISQCNIRPCIPPSPQYMAP